MQPFPLQQQRKLVLYINSTFILQKNYIEIFLFQEVSDDQTFLCELNEEIGRYLIESFVRQVDNMT